MRSSGIGGQAVIEGIMMKNKEDYAVAVRKPDGEIQVEKSSYAGISGKSKFFRLPFVRGIFNLADSLALGTKTLTFSAGFYEEEEGEPGKFEKFLTRVFGEKLEKVLTGVTVLLSVVFAVGLFMLLPAWAADWMKTWMPEWAVAVLEGLLRIGIFIGYVLLISRMEDIRRTFMYHGAEHKCINCIEHGLPLTVENVMKSSKQHKRCGTSFLLFVMVISIFCFMIIRVDTMWLKLVSRVLLIPVIAGISYEFLRLAGNSENPVVNALSRPGLWLQNLTTKEPEENMVPVAIAAVEAVFDWRSWEEENCGMKPAVMEAAVSGEEAAEK